MTWKCGICKTCGNPGGRAQPQEVPLSPHSQFFTDLHQPGRSLLESMGDVLLCGTVGMRKCGSLQTDVQSACLEARVCRTRADKSVGHQAVSFPFQCHFPSTLFCFLVSWVRSCVPYITMHSMVKRKLKLKQVSKAYLWGEVTSGFHVHVVCESMCSHACVGQRAVFGVLLDRGGVSLLNQGLASSAALGRQLTRPVSMPEGWDYRPASVPAPPTVTVCWGSELQCSHIGACVLACFTHWAIPSAPSDSCFNSHGKRHIKTS